MIWGDYRLWENQDGQLQTTIDKSSSAAPESAIDSFLADNQTVSALPDTTMRIIRMTSDRDANTSVLLKLISQDAAVAGRIMKAVNSAFYALPNKITRLDRAVAFMGMKAVKEVAVSATMAGMCKNISFGKYEDRDLWDHSVGVAILARACHPFGENGSRGSISGRHAA